MTLSTGLITTTDRSIVRLNARGRPVTRRNQRAYEAELEVHRGAHSQTFGCSSAEILKWCLLSIGVDIALGRKTGGRTAGTPNKRTLNVMERLDELGCDPIEGMAKIALDPQNPVELRARMFSDLAQYVAPKRRAIDHSGSEGTGPIEIRWLPSA